MKNSSFAPFLRTNSSTENVHATRAQYDGRHFASALAHALALTNYSQNATSISYWVKVISDILL